MSQNPVVAIVGRPNVGKSSLLNRIVGFRHAIVDPTPGVTRDRNYAEAVWNGRPFHVVDTGGLEPDDHCPLQQAIRSQVEFALREADAIIFVGDARDGLLGDDQDIFLLLRKHWTGKPLFVAINKIDNPNDEAAGADFYGLGIDSFFPISTLHGHGVADLLDAVVKPFPVDLTEKEKKPRERERIAIVGKPNVGKSSLFNRIIGEDRSIVDDVPGTTRDTITVPVVRNGRTYRFIDTAGLRRPDRSKDSVERYSVSRTLGAIASSDLAVLVLDAQEGEITHQDKRIAERIIEAKCGCVVLWNKWDVAERKSDRRWEELQKLTRESFPLLEFAPILSCSALTGSRVEKVFDLLDKVQEAGRHQIPAERLAAILFDALTIQPPPSFRGRAMRISALRQAEGPPVIFRVKCSEPDALHFSYQRFILNQIRQEFLFEGWPVKLFVGK